VKAIGASFIPLTPTSTLAHPFLPPQRVPRMFNRLSFTIVNGLLWRAFRAATNRARASVCALPPRRRNWTTHPMLYGVSPSLIPQPGDWPDHARVCGQWIPSLARAISFAERAERADVTARAREVGERMRQEDGLGVAARAIEALLAA
jgi:hypothetical protein